MRINRIWLGGEMPERYREYGELWKELNPDLELHDWTEEEIMDTEWKNKDVLADLWDQSRKPGADMIAYYTHVADVIDYEILWKEGGWYFNTDMKPIKPLSTLDEVTNWDFPGLAMEDDVHPVNMAMYSPEKHHYFFARVLDTLPKRYFSMPGAFMNATTGVQLLEESLIWHDGFINRWHRNVFNPIHWSDFNYGETPDIDREYPEGTVAVHEWLHRTNQRGQRTLET